MNTYFCRLTKTELPVTVIRGIPVLLDRCMVYASTACQISWHEAGDHTEGLRIPLSVALFEKTQQAYEAGKTYIAMPQFMHATSGQQWFAGTPEEFAAAGIYEENLNLLRVKNDEYQWDLHPQFGDHTAHVTPYILNK